MILGVDAILDMARTALNMLGNYLAVLIVARWKRHGREPVNPAKGNGQANSTH